MAKKSNKEKTAPQTKAERNKPKSKSAKKEEQKLYKQKKAEKNNNKNKYYLKINLLIPLLTNVFGRLHDIHNKFNFDITELQKKKTEVIRGLNMNTSAFCFFLF
ncbi:hypothetical protein BCR32DRAFT_274219 [Anaeromyces robustus]|uniref:Uncharacterized protein n=1 Tax=Anaeromyces robustus TaxID=1754192 RepID=A0A1Y1XPX3_9FUNG|nr:hypothetical protein BCR32DRAFT_274219 [Anaeromyces robustus]|eukprot:ORX87800.1 hypothetical protein BCR32DRAFT_274219 [Anaeromyces robustus]